MSNFFTDAAHDVKIAAIKTEHAVIDVVEFLPKASAIIADAIKDEPAVKAAVLGLVQAGGAVLAAGTGAVAAKGASLMEDAATVEDGEQFIEYFRTVFLPAIAKVWAEVKPDLGAN